MRSRRCCRADAASCSRSRRADQADSAQVAVLDLKTGQRKTLIRGGSDAQYVETGHLIFAAAGALRAVRFDPLRLELLGDPVTVVEHVLMKPTGAANYAVSRPGTLVYVPGGATEQTPIRSLVWVDRKGHEERINAPLRAYGLPRVSPDGTRLAIGVRDQGNTEIWIWDLARETLRRLTFAPGMDGLAVWTPDSRRIIFMSDRTGRAEPVQPGRRRHGNRRPADDKREPAVADVDHAGREMARRL